MNICLLAGLKTISVENLSCSKLACFYPIIQTLLYWTGVKLSLYGSHNFKTGWRVQQTVRGPQPRWKYVYFRTFFVDRLFTNPFWLNRLPLLQFMHRGKLNARFCFTFQLYHWYTDCSQKMYDKRPTHHRDQTALKRFSKSLADTFSVTSARVLENFIAVLLSERHNTFLHPIYLYISRHVFSLPFSKFIPSPNQVVVLFVSNSFPRRRWDEATGRNTQCNGDAHLVFDIHALSQPAWDLTTCPFWVSFDSRTHTIWVIKFWAENIIKQCSKPALWSTISCSPWKVFGIEPVYALCEEHNWNKNTWSKKFTGFPREKMSYFLAALPILLDPFRACTSFFAAPKKMVQAQKLSCEKTAQWFHQHGKRTSSTIEYVLGTPSSMKVCGTNFHFEDESSSSFNFDKNFCSV